MEQSKVHKACRNQAIPLTIIKKNARQKHVVLKSIDPGDLAPDKQPKIYCNDGVADDERVVVRSVTIALYWLSCERLTCDCPRRRRWWWRALRRNLRWGKVHGVSAVLFRRRPDWRNTTRLFGASHLRSRCCYASQVRFRRDWHQHVCAVDRRDVLGPTPVSH